MEIEIPTIAAGYRIIPKLEGLTLHDVKSAFSKFRSIPLGEKSQTEIVYEGRHLFTSEVVERMNRYLPLPGSGVGAISYYVKQLEWIYKIQGLHTALAPLLQEFLEDILFEKKSRLYDTELTSCPSNSDEEEHFRAVFVPLIRNKTTSTEVRMITGESRRLFLGKAYQVTYLWSPKFG